VSRLGYRWGRLRPQQSADDAVARRLPDHGPSEVRLPYTSKRARYPRAARSSLDQEKVPPEPYLCHPKLVRIRAKCAAAMWRPACNCAAQGMGYRKPIGKLEQHGSDGQTPESENSAAPAYGAAGGPLVPANDPNAGGTLPPTQSGGGGAPLTQPNAPRCDARCERHADQAGEGWLFPQSGRTAHATLE
jgi:hypothetical protein